MVRLVFRPYTQVRRAICTLAPLRASTRVSSGFTLLRHSSPSFGSQHVCSHSNLSQKQHGRSMVQAQAIPPVRLLALRGFSTHQLAYMLDSLVRVTRRAGWKPSASILRAQFPKDEGALQIPQSDRRHRPGSNPGFCPSEPTHADQRPARAAPR